MPVSTGTGARNFPPRTRRTTRKDTSIININELRQSNYLQKKDVEPATLVTIKEIGQENISKEGAEPNLKWILYFHEVDKGLVLNSTNGQIIAKIAGSDESDDWENVQIVLYHDPNVSFGGKLVGGIRVRAPKSAAGKPMLKPHRGNNRPVMAEEDEDSSIPF